VKLENKLGHFFPSFPTFGNPRLSLNCQPGTIIFFLETPIGDRNLLFLSKLSLTPLLEEMLQYLEKPSF